MIFYNNRLVQLNVKGILTYYDPKNLDQIKGEMDLKNRHVSVKITGKSKDLIEITSRDQTFVFKVIYF